MEKSQWIDKKLESGYTYHLKEFINETKSQEAKQQEVRQQNPTRKK